MQEELKLKISNLDEKKYHIIHEKTKSFLNGKLILITELLEWIRA
jgi:hypothetical protein